VPIIGEKVIKPAEQEPFPDSVVLSKEKVKALRDAQKKASEPRDGSRRR
jgi:hypothetical protein